MCMHLKPILNYLESEHNLKVIKYVNGKGMGVGNLVDGQIPFDEIINKKLLSSGVTVSKEHGLITCRECWENIAEHNRYNNNWG